MLWTAREDGVGRIRMQRFTVDGLDLRAGRNCPVDAEVPTDEQLNASAIVLDGTAIVAWEDRRFKHTVIMAAVEDGPDSCRFAVPMRISDGRSGRNLPYGAGHGVSRVAMARTDGKQVFAAWADKRDFRNGYDIWGAHYRAEDQRFGPNEMVQDDFGALSKQRHATVAGHARNRLVVAWDDDREGNPDVLLSWRDGDGWSDDWPVPVASGDGEQASPSIVIDRAGRLHITWVERDEPGGPTRLRYAMGHLNTE